MGAWLQDVRFAWRQLRKSLGFTAVAVITIALGIGPNTAIFSVVYGQLWGPREGKGDPSRRIVIWSRHGKEQGYGDRGAIHVSPRDYLEWKRQATSFEGIGAVIQTDMNLDDQTQNPQRITIQSYTPGLMTLSGIPLMMGRDFLPEEGTPGKEHELILGHKLWKERYNSDPHIVGKQVRLDNVPYTVVGVRIPGESDRRVEQIWTCLVVSPNQPDQDQRFLTVVGRLKDGVTAQQAQAEIDTISQRLAQMYPRSDAGWSADVRLNIDSWNDQRTMTNLWLLMATVSLVPICFQVVPSEL